ncbi:spore germination protein (amino acid permease) [Paenibacillus cellulosilyticus]|uniref:Spore germination protein (Amino acid permease) n=1 Tax=Paenibacillus cellulosilyticus TaxID=375489 RepID=A0A2V2YMG6_9BACL|nr:endospore germination permease [Paenibacillus cellulosilyticus]PWV95338.1 spore germination protein (amino acid permease) [Paenibacillus cellulosilyticus]QKS44050.1 endospore germination permease [Paenibacillus cellulosilyticus]
MAIFQRKISFLQAAMIFMLANGLVSHVIINPMLLDASGRDAWITVIVSGIILVPWCIMLAVAMRRSGQQKLVPWLSARTHPVIAWLLVLPVLVCLYMIGGMTASYTATWTISNYLPTTPPLVLGLLLTVISALCAIWGIRVIAITSGILLPIVIALGYFVNISNMPEKDFALLKPYLEHGWNKVWDGLIYAGGGYIEFAFLMTVQHHIRTKIKPWHIVVFAIIMVYISLGPIIGAITEFGPNEAAKQMTSPYEQWRLVKLGDYIEHLDFFSIYQWQSGAVIRMSLAIFLVVDMLPIRRPMTRMITIGLIALSYVILAVIPINEYTYYLFLYRYYFPISFVVLFVASAAWMLISMASKPSKEVR